jgi:hypothetical protein
MRSIIYLSQHLQLSIQAISQQNIVTVLNLHYFITVLIHQFGSFLTQCNNEFEDAILLKTTCRLSTISGVLLTLYNSTCSKYFAASLRSLAIIGEFV